MKCMVLHCTSDHEQVDSILFEFVLLPILLSILVMNKGNVLSKKLFEGTFKNDTNNNNNNYKNDSGSIFQQHLFTCVK